MTLTIEAGNVLSNTARLGHWRLNSVWVPAGEFTAMLVGGLCVESDNPDAWAFICNLEGKSHAHVIALDSALTVIPGIVRLALTGNAIEKDLAFIFGVEDK